MIAFDVIIGQWSLRSTRSALWPRVPCTDVNVIICEDLIATFFSMLSSVCDKSRKSRRSLVEMDDLLQHGKFGCMIKMKSTELQNNHGLIKSTPYHKTMTVRTFCNEKRKLKCGRSFLQDTGSTIGTRIAPGIYHAQCCSYLYVAENHYSDIENCDKTYRSLITIRIATECHCGDAFAERTGGV